MKKIALVLALVLFGQGCSLLGAHIKNVNMREEVRESRRWAPAVATEQEYGDWWNAHLSDRPIAKSALRVSQVNGMNYIEFDPGLWAGYKALWAESPGMAAAVTVLDAVAVGGLGYLGYRAVNKEDKQVVNNTITQNAYAEGDGDIDQTVGDGNKKDRGDRSTVRTVITNPFAPAPVE